jgi:hypothetical protein
MPDIVPKPPARPPTPLTLGRTLLLPPDPQEQPLSYGWRVRQRAAGCPCPCHRLDWVPV